MPIAFDSDRAELTQFSALLRQNALARGEAHSGQRAALVERSGLFFQRASNSLSAWELASPAPTVTFFRASRDFALSLLEALPDKADAFLEAQARMLLAFADSLKSMPPADAEPWLAPLSGFALELSEGLAPRQALLCFAQAPAAFFTAFFNALDPLPQPQARDIAAALACKGQLAPAALVLGSDFALFERPDPAQDACYLSLAADHAMGMSALLAASRAADLMKTSREDWIREAYRPLWRRKHERMERGSVGAFLLLLPSERYDPARHAPLGELARLALLCQHQESDTQTINALHGMAKARGLALDMDPEWARALSRGFLCFANEARLAKLILDACPRAGGAHAISALELCSESKDSAYNQKLIDMALVCARQASQRDPASLLKDSGRGDHPTQFVADLPELCIRASAFLLLPKDEPSFNALIEIIELCAAAAHEPSRPLPGRKRSTLEKLRGSKSEPLKAWASRLEALALSRALSNTPAAGARRPSL